MRPIPFLLAALLVCSPAAARGQGGVDLPTALAETRAANRDLLASRATVRAAEAGAREASAAAWPRLDLTAGLTHSDAVMPVAAPPGAEIDPAFFTGYEDAWGVRLAARQVLFAGGEVSAAARQAGAGAEAAAAELAEREAALLFQAKELFLRLLLAQRQADIAGNQRELALKHAAQAEKRHAAGDISRFELLQARVRAANLEAPVASAERARGEAAAQLSALMGRPPDTALVAAGELSVGDDTVPSPSEDDLSSRPALRAAELRAREAGEAEAAASGPRWPRLTAGAAYETKGEDASDLFADYHDNWSAFLQLDLNLFDGGAATARRSRAAALRQAAEESTARARQSARLDRDRALLQLAEARALRASAGQTVAEAEEAATIAGVGYSAGTATHLELSDAETALAVARNRLAEADYRFLVARAFLDYALGRNPPEATP